MGGLWVSGGDTGLARGFGGLVPRGEELIACWFGYFSGLDGSQKRKNPPKGGFFGGSRDIESLL